MKNILKRIFAPLTVFALALGIGLVNLKNTPFLNASAEIHSLTVTRSNFASGSLAYNVDDAWSSVDTAGNTITGTFDLYSNASQTTMQSKNTGIANNFNNATTMLPGSLRSVKVVSAAGTSRTWTLYASDSTPLTLSNYSSSGTNLGGKSVTGTNNAETIWTGITGTYKYLYLAISSGASFANSITIEYDIVSGSFGTLDHIDLATSGAQLQFPVGSTFSSSGLVVTAFDNSTPAFSKVVTSFTTDYDDYIFEVTDLGSIIVTVTYEESGNAVTNSYEIEVVNLVLFNKISNIGDLHFGATYIIVNEANNKVLGIDNSNTYRVSNDVTINSNSIVDSSAIQKFKLVISPELGSYGFQLINGDAAGNYLNYTGTSNTLTTDSDITVGASWNLSFTDGDVSIVLSTNTSRKIGYNTGSPRFAAYTSAQAPIQLYLDTTSVDSSLSASLVASEVNIGSGNTAFNKCEAVLEFLTNAIDRLSLDSKSIFNTSSESAFVSARARIAYLQAWVLANPSGGSVRLTSPVSSSSTLMATFIISAIGITSLLGYYFVNQRRKIH